MGFARAQPILRAGQGNGNQPPVAAAGGAGGGDDGGDDWLRKLIARILAQQAKQNAPGAFAAKGEIAGVRAYPDGSLRTPDGKFAGVSGTSAPGMASANRFVDFLSSSGVDVVGRELEVNGPLGVRRYDVVTRNANGSLHGLEIKSGSATRSLYQDFSDRFINRYGATGRGRISGQIVTGNSVVYLPEGY
jgi:hypothetical protein